ncbi:hypothetical protein VPH35_045291 [Triticum aestivum]
MQPPPPLLGWLKTIALSISGALPSFVSHLVPHHDPAAASPSRHHQLLEDQLRLTNQQDSGGGEIRFGRGNPTMQRGQGMSWKLFKEPACSTIRSGPLPTI